MKHFFRIAALATALTFSQFANATLVNATSSEKHDISTKQSLTLSVDYADFSFGYTPGVDSIDGAWLSLILKDTGPDKGGKETFSIFAGASQELIYSGSNIPNGNNNYGPFSLTGSVLDELSSTGSLSFLIRAYSGSFEFVSATLRSNILFGLPSIEAPVELPGQTTNESPTDVPEPLSLALLGLGLAGIAALRRKA